MQDVIVTDQLQEILLTHGYYVGLVDGIKGPKTKEAISRFKLHMGLNPRPWVGPITLEKLMRYENPLIMDSDPIWLKYATTFNGLKEIPGRRHNPIIVQWWKDQGMSFRDDETPWCAAYVNQMFKDCRIPNPGRANARSYTKWGQEVKNPVRGSVVVFWRGKPNGWSGHVGFVMGKDQDGNLMVLGGNQGNEVNIKPFSMNRVLTYRWPDRSLPNDYERIIISSDGELSHNEA